MWDGATRRPGRNLAWGMALTCLSLLASQALAADQFQGTYQGVYLGYDNAAGRHYCYYAGYSVNGSGGITGYKFQSTEGVGAAIGSPLATDYTVFRREGLLMGGALPYTARAHGRLRDDLEAGTSTAIQTQTDWYMGLFGLAYGGSDLGNHKLFGDYWTARCGYRDEGPSQAHWAGFGIETYDGAGGLGGSWDWDDQVSGSGTGPISTTYALSGEGTITRGGTENGFYLDNGDLLIYTDVTSATQWKIALSLRKPGLGSMGPGMLNGSYWFAYYRFHDDPSDGSDVPNHGVMAGKIYFDGGGTAVLNVVYNRSDGQNEAGMSSMLYTVDADGWLSLGGLLGGISPDGRTALGVAMDRNSHELWGYFVLFKNSGIEDPSPLCHLLGLTP